MPEYNFQLRGWHALVAIALLLGFVGLKSYLRVRPVDDALRDAVRTQLLNDYSGRSPRDIARLVTEAREGLPVEQLQPVVQRDIEFTSIAGRGGIAGPARIVRAEITVDGGPPPDGRSVRFFRVSRKFAGDGWMVVGESDSYRYFMELLN
jgi:hypothetical protein